MILRNGVQEPDKPYIMHRKEDGISFFPIPMRSKRLYKKAHVSMCFSTIKNIPINEKALYLLL